MQEKIKNKIKPLVRDIVFGLEDGMVSTLGALTGVAIGSNNQSIILLSGVVVIAVESVSMGIGSYLSNQTEHEMREQLLNQEKQQIKNDPEGEILELQNIYIKDGWPKKLSKEMSETAFKNKELFFSEMAHHELSIIPQKTIFPFKNGLFMFFSYIIGGVVPLISYIFLPISAAIISSTAITLGSLFLIGIYLGKYNQTSRLRSGLRMFILAGIAIIIGFLVGKFFSL